MKTIAYVTTYDARDVRAFSGSGNRIARALAAAGHPVELVGRPMRRSLVIESRRLASRTFSSKAYRPDRDPVALDSHARTARRGLARLDFDIVVSPGTLAIARLEIEKPIVVWTDATFAGMLDYYPSFTNLSKRSILNGHRAEAAALAKAAALVYTSEWAARSAIENYDVDPAKVSVVHFGANTDALVEPRQKSFDSCTLLFVGVDWDRKGGDLALAVTEALNARGIPTKLHVVGCEPPYPTPSFVTRHGFLSRDDAAQVALITELYAESHFLIVPSKAECAAVVFAAASRAGLPSIGSTEGGIPDVVREGVNGALFDRAENPQVIGDYIENLLAHPDEYLRLAASSLAESHSRLNWQTAGEKMSHIIEGVASK